MYIAFLKKSECAYIANLGIVRVELTRAMGDVYIVLTVNAGTRGPRNLIRQECSPEYPNITKCQ